MKFIFKKCQEKRVQYSETLKLCDIFKKFLLRKSDLKNFYERSNDDYIQFIAKYVQEIQNKIKIFKNCIHHKMEKISDFKKTLNFY